MYKLCIYIISSIILTFQQPQKDSLTIQKIMDEAYTFEQKQPQKALQLYTKSHQLSLKFNYKEGAYKSLLYSGIVYSNVGKYDSAQYFYNKCINYSKRAKILIGEAKGYVNLANLYQFKGDYPSAIKNYIKSIKIFEKTKDSVLISQSYQNLSAVYNSFKNEKLELFYLKKAEDYGTKLNKEQLGLLYGDIGLMLLRQDHFNEAFGYFKKAETLSKTEKNIRPTYFAIRNMGEYYKHIRNYKRAISYYIDALELSDLLNDTFQKDDLLYILSGVYFNDNNFKNALYYGNQALSLAKKIDSDEMEHIILKRLSTIYYKTGQHQKAYLLLEQSYDLKDSVINNNHIKETTLLQTKFETEKKDKSIAEQQIQLKQQELDLIKSKKEKQLYFIGFIALIVVSIGIWYFFKQRQNIKNKEILALKQQQEINTLEALMDGEEKERRRIAQELHDGLNGDLSAIKYRLSTLEEAGLSAIDADNLNKVIDMIDESCAQVRNISHDLMPTSILEYGLIETIKEYCFKINSSKKIKINFQYFGNYIALAKKNETVIYRIIQEMVTNILKHSKATEAIIQFNYREEELFITIEDNGIGFDKSAITEGIGHKNIKTRVAFLNAQLDSNSSDSGTSYTLSIDLNKTK